MDPPDETAGSEPREDVDNPDETMDFRVDVSTIESVSKDQQASELQSLELEVFDHATLEKGIIAQVNEAIKSVHDNVPASVEALEEGEHESSRDEDDFTRKLRLGEVTPFDNSEEAQSLQEKARNGFNEALQRYMENQARLQKSRKKKSDVATKQPEPPKIPNKRKLGKPKEFNPERKKEKTPKRSKLKKRTSPKKKKKETAKEKLRTRKHRGAARQDTSVQPGEESSVNLDDSSGSEYLPSESDESGGEELSKPCKPLKSLMSKMTEDDSDSDWSSSEDEYVKKRKSNKELDDGDPHYFTKRVKGINRLEYTEKLHTVLDEFKCPKVVWDKLYKYQQVAVKWFWELNQQRCGGILGDEMGLGKTIQVVAFLSGLYVSGISDYDSGYSGLGPSIIVCPTTVMHQWVREFHKWFPILRVAILHESGTYSTTGKERSRLIDSIHSHDYGILITSYTGLVKHSKKMLEKQWHYVILDEGHKIRNHQAQVTLVAKQLETPHRLILSGSPFQNNLRELWSLFDFIFPGKLGTLQVFTNVFHMPIITGGYTNASSAAVMQAFKCAVILKDTVTPYLLRRLKCDVDAHIRLPPKTEQVLFCKLTEEQRELYKNYLCGVNIEEMIRGNAQIFVGLINLRKICNHPDLYAGDLRRDSNEKNTLDEDKFGYWGRAGKMIVVRTLLKIWKQQNHRVLLFTQTQKMLMILENFVKQCGYKYLKLDGKTSVAARQPLIDKFNKDTSYFVMLLTTKVGGLGVNLTGANRVVIYDPDWNPATDTQARERAWRIGQVKDVTVYRLVTAGTIEEKIYHRQIFKQFLSNKVLKDPRQRRFFKSNDLSELFTLSETVNDGTTETAAIFAGTGSEVKLSKISPKKKMKYSVIESAKDPKITFSDSKIEQMKRLAHMLSQKIGNKSVSETSSKEIESLSAPKPCCSKTIDNEQTEAVERNPYKEEPVFDEIYGPDGEIMANKVVELKKPSVTSPHDTRRRSEEGTSKILTDENDNHTEENGLGKRKRRSSSSSKDKHEKKKRREKHGQFEGYDVPHLLKCRKMKRTKEPEKLEIDAKSQDDYVLQKLFSKTGIETALRHDSIMESGPNDYAIIEAEADKLAQEAIKALKASSAEVPVARKPLLKPTVEGSALLSAIKKRNLAVDVTDAENQLVRSLVDWLCAEGGVASTDKIIEEFQSKVGPGKSPVFKSLLGKIATFSRGANKIGYWTIKEEFKM